jgi:pyruvate dehydrogenase E2 component (dihydrolipoamide acetyltransferase)
VREVVVPDIGDFSDIPVIEVLVKPGDSVAQEDPLVTLESDKASMDVPSPFAGVVQEVEVAVGDRVSEGAVILTLADGDGDADADADGAEAVPSTPDEAGTPAGPQTAIAAEASDAEEAAPAPAAREQAAGEGADRDGGGAGPVYASPAVRRLARERGVDLMRVTGSGRKGRITKEDVETAAAGEAPAAAAGPATGADLGLAPWPQVDFEKYGPVERVTLSRIKRIAGPVLARNWVMIPHVTQHDEADITDLEAFRVATNEAHAKEGVKLTMVALLLKACVATLQAFPECNASLAGDELVLKRYYHLGFAADTPQGLVVPVIRDVDQKGLIALAQELRELSGKARDGKLMPGDMAGGTFTISSLGGIGGTGFTPIVNAPEVAILGVSKSAHKPVWNGSEFVPRLMLPLSLSYDHRVIDGAAAARFTAHLSGVLSDLRRVLL